jgi:hypothetical protein
MPLNTLRKIWLAVALINLIICLDFFATVQGWPVNIGTDLILEFKLSDFSKDARPQAALHGLVTALPFLCMTTWLAFVHAKRATGGFAERMPFRLMDIDPASGDGKVIQRITFFVAFILPFYAVGHFWRKLIDQHLCFDYRGTTVQHLSLLELDWSQGTDRNPWHILDNSFRFASIGNEGCNGPTFQPFLEPLVLGFFTLLALLFFGRFVFVAINGSPANAPS